MPQHRHTKKMHRAKMHVAKQPSTTLDGTTYTLEMAIPRSQLSKPLRNHFAVTQMFDVAGFFPTSTSVPTFSSITVSLSQFDSASSLVQVFDQYRIMEIEIWITPQTSADVSTRQGQYFSVLDFDDATLLSTTAQALDYPTCVATPQSTGHYRRFAPHVAIAAYGGSVFTSFANQISPWLDTSSSSIPHYGVKIAAGVSNGTIQTFDLTVRALILFRAVR
jgi:hypothetical protein